LFKRFWNINIENGFGIYILKFEAQIMAKNVNWSKIGVGIKIFFKVTIFSINVHTYELLAHKVEGFIAWES
jgi:hypothetical protein